MYQEGATKLHSTASQHLRHSSKHTERIVRNMYLPLAAQRLLGQERLRLLVADSAVPMLVLHSRLAILERFLVDAAGHGGLPAAGVAVPT